MPFATSNYGWTLPDAGAEPFSWEPFVRTAFQGIDTTMFSKFNKSGGTISGAVMIDTDGGGYSSTEPLFVGKAANAAVNAVLRNNSSGSSASAGVVVNAYGNSWRMAIGSAAKNNNRLTWEVDALGSPVEKMGLTADGNLLVGTTSGNHHTLSKAGASDYATTIINTSGTTPYGQRIILSGVTGGSGAGFLSCQDDAERFRVLGNGNVQNINNSYGAISDANLKRDVTETGPKLSKVLAMRIVNYFLIADPTNTKLLGMIAQELREISPGLVEANPDYEDVVVEPARTDTVTRQRQKAEARTVTRWKVEVRDGVAVRSSVEVTEHVPLFIELPLVGEDGQQIVDIVGSKQVPAVFRQPVMEDYTETVDVPAKIERRATGTTTLSIKYSILVPMLVKAMQELHADFDARLGELEARA